MILRTNASGNGIMPPASSEAGPLTDDEKNAFNELLEVLNSSVEEENITITEEVLSLPVQILSLIHI